MRHINYNHLFYFWNVAEFGSIAGASKRLYLTPQTISTQIKLLEQATGTQLFEKSGRRLVLTEQGTVVKGFADEIFSLGTELSLFMRGGEKQDASELYVGIVETLPKIAVEQFLEPAFDAGVKLCCFEGNLDDLIADLSSHKLDMILSDRSVPAGDTSNLAVSLLGVSRLALFAPEAQWQSLQDKAPAGLNDLDVILPDGNSPLRRAGEDWFLQHGITPSVVAECSDSGLIKAMAAAGRGAFIAPLNIRAEIEATTSCRLLLTLDGFSERYFAITLDKKMQHPLVNELADSARTSLTLE
jgi:LysR family transcriptional activator of nhaA